MYFYTVALEVLHRHIDKSDREVYTLMWYLDGYKVRQVEYFTKKEQAPQSGGTCFFLSIGITLPVVYLYSRLHTLALYRYERYISREIGNVFVIYTD